MSDELLDHYREYGVPQTYHVYSQSQDGAIHDETYAQMESLSDFETGSFYAAPKKPQPLKSAYRSGRYFLDPPAPPRRKSALTR